MASDKADLIQSVRRGDLVRVRYLVEQREVELNVRDKWDSTPLYYACLCGRFEIVQYLLERGARCQANTFDGERCQYGALTDAIRTLLKNYNVLTTRTIKRNTFDEFLRKLFEQRSYTDVTFIIEDRSFALHRCVLASRSSFFREAFRNRWKDKTRISLRNAKFNADTFEALVRYFYTNCCEIALENVESLKALAKHCRSTKLIDLIRIKEKEIDEWNASKESKNLVYRLVLESDEDDPTIRSDFRSLADQAVPVELRPSISPGMENFSESSDLEIFSDVTFIIDQFYSFRLNQAFVCNRTEYFSALVKNHFNEMISNCSEEQKPTMILKHIRKELFLPLIYYIYSDECDIDEDCVDDLLVLADELLLPGLKRLCGNTYSKMLTVDSVVATLRLARLFELVKLEHQCIRFISEHLNEILTQEDFQQIVVEDASSVIDRQETDSITVIDDLRFYLTEFLSTNDDQSDKISEKLQVLDEFVERLGL